MMNRILKKIKTVCSILIEEGLSVFLYKIKVVCFGNPEENNEKEYKKWIKISEKDILDTYSLDYNPLISVIVPVYNVKEKMLEECINSVLCQTYKNWELCISDDASTMPEVKKTLEKYKNIPNIKIKYRNENGHISRNTNTALEMALGEFVAFMDCDDVLAPNALYEVAKLLNEDRKLDFIYSDEDKIKESGKKRHQPHFKPDWSPDTMMSLMYTCHLGVYRKSIGDEIGWLREGVEGAQDYDFTLRFTEKTQRIGHISKILYHWRERKESTAMNPEAKEYIVEATRKVKEDALKRRGYTGELEWVEDIYQFRVNYYNNNKPLVSVIIPSKDNFDVYKRCVDSIIEKTKYSNYEIITVDNGSKEENKLKYEDYALKNNIKYIYIQMEFNFSKMCNIGVANSNGEMILLLNDDIEIISDIWMERMVGHASLPYIGAVGAKLLYPNSTLIQHIGVLNFENGPVHSFCKLNDENTYYFCRNKIEYNYCAVTAACLMVSRDKYNLVGGLNENFAVAYNDINFCFDLLKKGYYNVARMDVVLYHHESLSRGSDVLDEKKYKRLVKERNRLYENHPEFSHGDRFYNPNLTSQKADCSIKNLHVDKITEIKNTKTLNKKGVEKKDTCFLLENILVNSEYIHVEGSFILKNERFNNLYKTEVYLVSKEKTYKINTRRKYREETNEIMCCKGKNNLASFSMTISKDAVISGIYYIYLRKHGQIINTGKKIKIEVEEV
ncbi:MAG: glycosyltransferase [Clostridium sp.]|nr:glycosyltransferase [Clostridium sp.]